MAWLVLSAPKGRGIQPSRHSPNIRASAAAWLIARGNETLASYQPIEYPIPPNKRIEKYKEKWCA